MMERYLIVQKLIRMEMPVDEALQSLRPFGWDSDRALVILQSDALAAVLVRFMQSELSAAEVEQWANAIEGREDIAYEASYSNVIGDIIHKLANPMLTTPLTRQMAQAMYERLRG